MITKRPVLIALVIILFLEMSTNWENLFGMIVHLKGKYHPKIIKLKPLMREENFLSQSVLSISVFIKLFLFITRIVMEAYANLSIFPIPLIHSIIVKRVFLFSVKNGIP